MGIYSCVPVPDEEIYGNYLYYTANPDPHHSIYLTIYGNNAYRLCMPICSYGKYRLVRPDNIFDYRQIDFYSGPMKLFRDDFIDSPDSAEAEGGISRARGVVIEIGPNLDDFFEKQAPGEPTPSLKSPAPPPNAQPRA